jgi:adenosylcobyric acid synthase
MKSPLTIDHRQPTPCLSVLGTGSDVGKSIIATALCRIFSDMGLRVAPYKAQNMSNNSGVTPEGLEMGRAQIVQAEAARTPPHVDMNPILLKPTSDVGSQIVLMGKAVSNATARDYHERKQSFQEIVNGSLDRLKADFDLIVMEGAGSCAEVNLMENDIVNLSMADYARAPVILVGDIHKGGIFAQMVGTLACLPEHYQSLIAGFIINRFRGDITLFKDGKKWIEERTGKPVFGVVPWFSHFKIEAEDSVVIENPSTASIKTQPLPALAVIRIPHISNFTDFDPLINTPGLNVYFVEKVQDLSLCNGVIIPGSKNTRFDLQWLHDTGWTQQLQSYAKAGGHLLGICGGYQMLGAVVQDPEGTEAKPGNTPGLSLLPIETVLKAPKTTTRSRFRWDNIQGTGYEIHMGQSILTDGHPLFRMIERNGTPSQDTDGCRSVNGNVMGTYIHGLFDTPDVTRRWLETIGLPDIAVSESGGYQERDQAYDLLAEHFKAHVDMEAISRLVGR